MGRPRKQLTLSSCVASGQIILREGRASRLLADEPYLDEAQQTFSYLQNTLCAETFDHLCLLAEKRAIRRQLFFKKLRVLP